ncbi:hypothetical protein [Streptomyces sp. NPDC002853]
MEGHEIGVLQAVCVDISTAEPAAATVRTGLPNRHRLLSADLRRDADRRGHPGPGEIFGREVNA